MAIHRSSQETVERLRGILHSTLEGARDSVEAASKSAGLVAYFVKLRSRLENAQFLFREADSVADDELVLREAQLLFLRRRDEFHHTSRSDLIRAWNDLLADATQKVYRDRVDAALYAADAQQLDESDRAFYSATRRIAHRG